MVTKEISSRGDATLVVTTVTFSLATVFVVARLISRFVILKTRTADDWCMIVAWFLAFGLSFSIDYGTAKGLGRRDVDIPSDWLPSLRRAEYAFTILYNPALMATKNSILIFYLRMAKHTQNHLRLASYITLALVNIGGLTLTFLNAFQCNPVSAAHDIHQTGAKCMSIVTLYLCSAPVNIFTDLAILVLPIPVLTGMRLPSRQKTVLIVTFTLGVFVTIVDVIRIFYLQQSSDQLSTRKNTFGATTDFSWYASTALLWSAVEVNVGIICACIPTLKPLVKRILPNILRDSNHTVATKAGSLNSQMDHIHDRLPSIAGDEPRARPPGALPPHEQGRDHEAEVDMMDFLTTPQGMENINTPGGTMTMEPTERTHTLPTNKTSDNSLYFGFVNMKRPKSMLKTHGMESFKYCAMVTTLFFLWGFSYGLLNILNNEISIIAKQTTEQLLGLTAAYFGAYFFGAMTVGQWTLRHGGFKATFIVGLCIYGTGTLCFWPSAVLLSYPGFIISNFVVAFGLSVLETAANPFIALCGPSSSAEFRLLMAQGVQAVGSVLSQLLAEKVLFQDLRNNSLIDVQWAYLAVALFTVILALFFHYMPLPEATDADLQIQADDLGVDHKETVFSPKIRLIYATLGLAIFSQYCYVAAQESMSVWISSALQAAEGLGKGTLTIDNFILVGHTTFAIGRFLFGALCLIIHPRILLLFALLGCLLFSTLIMALRIPINGLAGPTLMFYFFEGPVFPMVYAIGIRGLGKRTKIGASAIAAATSGGAMFPFVMFAVQRLNRKSVQYSFCIIVALSAFGLLFPVYLNLVPKARKQVDPTYYPAVGEPVRRLSNILGAGIEKIRGSGSEERSPGLPTFEHREGRGDSWGVDRDVMKG
ncbi:hypothetical protein HYFRA_00001606 [Hymenoscyphus fraxineus]|uniref:Rhodopsin domain-containing protein n=1 Tax=Hymenoscyphus fraxineus TaxID=746836 RepID=A0A9N9L8K9_9HELO|nr:hypothetical protein HYFRA_00001606 [Hymenoscyphus fraxineus]